jgi:ATP-dependent helicase HrpB
LAELSVKAVLPRLAAALAAGQAAVLVAPPGSGKTTLTPQALLAAGVGGGRQVVMLEPRRIAARAAARRIAELGGWKLGGEVGYQVRFERRAGASTRILVVTEGILVQMLQGDPFLEGIGVLIFDELHERTLAADMALAMARRVQREARPDLRLLAMSATLDPGPLAAFLGGCPVLVAPHRQFEVEVSYAGDLRAPAGAGTPRAATAAAAAARANATAAGGFARRLALDAAAAVRRALDATSGDVLVFLPGRGEIQLTAAALDDLARRRGLAVVQLYGDLPPERQDEALRPSTRRRIVLATNVAETSVTVEGVTAVVDCGLARRLRYDAAAGLDRLELARISRAAADQRAGRAGRQGPGICLRLWPAHEQAARPAFETPEIARVDLAGPALQLLAWGETDLAAFGWFEAPAAESLAAAQTLLVRLGAVDPGGAGVTADGTAMARLPAHPRLARLLLEGHRLGVAAGAALAAALLAERDPFPRPPRQPGRAAERASGATHSSRSDLLDRLDALLLWQDGGGRTADTADTVASAGGAGAALSPAAARFILRARDQLAETARRELGAPAVEKSGAERDDGLLRAVLAAYPDRVARRREPNSPRAVMVGGRGVRLAAESAVLAAELFVCVDVAAAGAGGTAGAAAAADVVVRLASAIEADWLAPRLVHTTTEVGFDAGRQRVSAWRRTRYEDLLIDEREVPAADSAAVSALLAESAAADLAGALPLDEPAVAALVSRWRCLAAWMPELALPALDAAVWRQLLPELARGRRSFAELRRAPLLDALRGLLTHTQWAALEREAPERLAVPSGSRIPLLYEEGKPPVLAARIQELFGLAETPRIAAGRIAVLLHLLAPNHRPQQVTADLHSFWHNTYPQVRRELQGRYPRHAWPQDPWTARPERRPASRRRG